MRVSLRNRGLQTLDASSLVMTDDTSAGAADASKPSHLDVIAMDVSHNRLHLITGARYLKFLRDLDLSFNNLTSLIGLPPSLERLSVAHNALTSLEGANTLISLRYLDASNNKIASIQHDSVSPSVTSLYLSSNLLKSCKGLTQCQQLLSLHVDNNDIGKLEDIAVLGGLRSLRHLTVAGNPVANNPSLVSALERAIPKLTTLNKVPLSQAAYRMHLEQARRSSASRGRSSSSHREASTSKSYRSYASSARTYSAGKTMDFAPEDEDDIEDLTEMNGLEARVKELTSLLKSELAKEAELKKKNAQLKSQLRRTNLVVEEQQYELEKIRMQNDALTKEAAPLQRAYAALDNAFKHQHASVVFSKLSASLTTKGRGQRQ